MGFIQYRGQEKGSWEKDKGGGSKGGGTREIKNYRGKEKKKQEAQAHITCVYNQRQKCSWTVLDVVPKERH